MPPFPDLPRPLTGDRAALREAAERDIPEVLIAHQDDPALAGRLRLERPPSGAELGRRTERAAALRADGAEAWLTILAPDGDGFSDECRGQLDVYDVDDDHARVRVSLWVAPRERRRGLGSGALALAGRWLLTDVGLQRVELLADADDAAARAVGRAAGLREEGVLRGYLLDRRGRVDVAVLSLVRADLG